VSSYKIYNTKYGKIKYNVSIQDIIAIDQIIIYFTGRTRVFLNEPSKVHLRRHMPIICFCCDTLSDV